MLIQRELFKLGTALENIFLIINNNSHNAHTISFFGDNGFLDILVYTFIEPRILTVCEILEVALGELFILSISAEFKLTYHFKRSVILFSVSLGS